MKEEATDYNMCVKEEATDGKDVCMKEGRTDGEDVPRREQRPVSRISSIIPRMLSPMYLTPISSLLLVIFHGHDLKTARARPNAVARSLSPTANKYISSKASIKDDK